MTRAGSRDAGDRRSVLQLTRLERLTDVVYAIVIWRVFAGIPSPADSDWIWDSAGGFLADNLESLVISLLAMAIVTTYWIRSAQLLGNLERTDGRHTSISVFQLMFLFLFLFAIGIGIDLPASPANRAFESAMAALLGFGASGGWIYAVRHGLVHADVDRDEAHAISDRTLAEPLTALLTIPFAFVGPWMWEAAWLLYPVVTRLLTRRRGKQAAAA